MRCVDMTDNDAPIEHPEHPEYPFPENYRESLRRHGMDDRPRIDPARINQRMREMRSNHVHARESDSELRDKAAIDIAQRDHDERLSKALEDAEFIKRRDAIAILFKDTKDIDQRVRHLERNWKTTLISMSLLVLVIVLLLLLLPGHAHGQTTTVRGAAQGSTTAQTVTATGIDANHTALDVNIAGGGGSGGTASNFGSSFPSTGTAIGVKNGANMVNLTADNSNNLDVNCIVGCSAAGDQNTTSTALGALNNTISVPLAGERGIAFQLQSGGTGIYTVTPQCSFDGGVIYNANGYIQDPVTGATSLTAVISSGQATTDYLVICPGGASHAQMIVTAFTSGTANWLARSTVITWPGIDWGVVTTNAPSYTTGHISPMSLDTSGLLRMSIKDTPSNINNLNVAVAAALPAGTNVIGHVIADTGSTTAVTQATAGNLNATVVNAGTFAVQSASTIADGADVTLGAKADAKSAATDTTAVSIMQVLKEISSLEQAPASRAVTNTGTFAVQAATTIADGADTTLGAKADAKNSATDTTAVSVMSVLKEISSLEQAPASRAVTNAGTFLTQSETEDGAGNAITSNSTTFTAKHGLDVNMLGTLGTAFTTAGFVDIKGADGNVFVRQTTGSNLHAVIDTGSTTAVTQATAANLNAQVVGAAADGAALSGNPVTMAGKGSGNANIPVVCDNWKPFSLASTTALKIISLASAKQIYICSINIVSAAANNVALIEGTKTTNDCDTATAGMAGGTTAATGWNFAANGGLTQGSGVGAIMRTATAAHDVCLLASGSGQVSGVVSWTQF